MDEWLKTKDLPTHFVAACGLVMKEDKVLLIHSERRGWEIPGGVVERKENILDALKREIREESGVECEPTCLVGVYQNCKEKEGYGPLEGIKLPTIVTFGFLCRYVSGEPGASEESEESSEAGWFTKEQARQMVTYSSYDVRLADMLSYDGTVAFRSYELDREGNIAPYGEDRILDQKL